MWCRSNKAFLKHVLYYFVIGFLLEPIGSLARLPTNSTGRMKTGTTVLWRFIQSLPNPKFLIFFFLLLMNFPLWNKWSCERFYHIPPIEAQHWAPVLLVMHLPPPCLFTPSCQLHVCVRERVCVRTRTCVFVPNKRHHLFNISSCYQWLTVKTR